MTAVVVVLSVVVAVLAVLVAGLLRAYADLLRRLHALDGGGQDAEASGAAAAPPFQVREGVVSPVQVEGRQEWTAAHDVQGTTPSGEQVAMRLVQVEHDTIAVFLSSGCTGCERYWQELQQGWRPAGSRLVVLTKDADEESPALVAGLAPRDVEVVMSSQAWADYEVPGSPFVVAVHGPSGRVRGHGSAASLGQVEGLIGRAGGDGAGTRPGAVVKSAGDREREADVDAELARSGIGPGHPSLYAATDDDHDHGHDHLHDHGHDHGHQHDHGHEQPHEHRSEHGEVVR